MSFAAGSAADTTAAIAAGINGNKAAYGVALATAGATTVTIKYTDPSVYLGEIVLEGVHGTAPGSTLIFAQTTAPDMGRGTAKQLYESVRLGTGVNYKPFEHTADRQVNMNSSYKTLSFDITYSGPLGIDGINDVNSRRAEFIIYIEDSVFTASEAGGDAFNEFVVEVGLAHASANTFDEWLGSDDKPIYIGVDTSIVYPA